MRVNHDAGKRSGEIVKLKINKGFENKFYTGLIGFLIIFFHGKQKTLVEYPVKVVYQNENNVVVQIKDVPKKYRVVGLFVKEIRDEKVLESEVKNKMLGVTGSVDQNGEEVKIELPKPKEKVIVGDYRKVKTNNTLGIKGELDYQKEQIEIEIGQVVKKIHLLEKEQIPLQDDIVLSIQAEIKALEKEMNYKTEAEKLEVGRQIANKKTAIINEKEQQENYQKIANELRDKRKMLLKKLEDIHSSELEKGDRNTGKEGTGEVGSDGREGQEGEE